jgi:YesN/AraC family two-component response regulator
MKNLLCLFILDPYKKKEMKIDLKNLTSPSKRIDRAIELLVYYKLTLIEIAYQLNYRSVEDFVNQFKNWVGYSPEDFKQLILGESEKEVALLSRI